MDLISAGNGARRAAAVSAGTCLLDSGRRGRRDGARCHRGTCSIGAAGAHGRAAQLRRGERLSARRQCSTRRCKRFHHAAGYARRHRGDALGGVRTTMLIRCPASSPSIGRSATSRRRRSRAARRRAQAEYPRFVIQKHDASRLHYDLRLETAAYSSRGRSPRAPRSIRRTSASPWRWRTIRSTTAISKARSRGRVWRRHGDAVGPRLLAARRHRRRRRGAAQGRAEVRPGR